MLETSGALTRRLHWKKGIFEVTETHLKHNAKASMNNHLRRGVADTSTVTCMAVSTVETQGCAADRGGGGHC